MMPNEASSAAIAIRLTALLIVGSPVTISVGTAACARHCALRNDGVLPLSAGRTPAGSRLPLVTDAALAGEDRKLRAELHAGVSEARPADPFIDDVGAHDHLAVQMREHVAERQRCGVGVEVGVEEGDPGPVDELIPDLAGERAVDLVERRVEPVDAEARSDAAAEVLASIILHGKSRAVDVVYKGRDVRQRPNRLDVEQPSVIPAIPDIGHAADVVHLLTWQADPELRQRGVAGVQLENVALDEAVGKEAVVQVGTGKAGRRAGIVERGIPGIEIEVRVDIAEHDAADPDIVRLEDCLLAEIDTAVGGKDGLVVAEVVDRQPRSWKRQQAGDVV